MSAHARYLSPIELRQRGRYQNLSCVTAQVLYMAGVTAQPDVDLVDQEIGRQPQAQADGREVDFLLLRSGLSVHVISAYDEQRMLAEGLSYLREYYQDSWTPAWDGYFTEAWLQGVCEQVERLRLQYSQTLHHLSHELRQPDITDIHRLLADGWLLIVPIEGDPDPSQGSVLVYGWDESGNLSVYLSNNRGKTLQTWPPSYLQTEWVVSEGLVAVKPAS